MKRITFASGVFVTVLVACAPSSSRGVIAMKISDEEAHLDLGRRTVAVGDRVSVFRNVCPPGFTGTKSQLKLSPGCEKRKVGTGRITEILNGEYSIATFPKGVGIEEGDVVETD